MQKLTTYINREKIRGEYKMVSFRTKEYDLLKSYHSIHITEEESETILKWLAISCKMRLNVNFKNCHNSWGGLRRNKPFVTIARNGQKNITTIGIVLHEFTHAHNYYFGSGRNHNDGFVLTLDKFVRKFNKTKSKEMIKIKRNIEKLLS